ncbi:MAG: RraA family protein [Acidobacteria bacterium]|nr:RraA family protein [Acidobacteriota bacterium]
MKCTQDLKAVSRELYVAAVCDVLDSLGHRDQAMHQRLRPLLSSYDACGFIGRARTFEWEEPESVDPKDPYGLEIEAMDTLQAGDVVVHSTDALGKNAAWGELMTTVAKCRGAVGCVCDSNIRDCAKIVEMQFPVFYAGIRPVDSVGRGRVKAYDVPITCGGVVVHSGDIVFADFDGVVVIPSGLADEVLRLAEERIKKENRSRIDLKNGETLRRTYERYGVL